MATKNKNTTGRKQIEQSNSESTRWIIGLLVAFIGLYIASSVFFSFFNWDADQSGLQLTTEERETLGVTPANMCGWMGAWVGMWLVDQSFGVFGILLPIILLLLGVRIIRRRPLLFNHLTLSLLLVTLLGSLTLGFAFGTKWSLCASTGWGGEFGIAVAELLKSHIGNFGTTILLLAGWILTGVFINRNFIHVVNGAGQVVVDKSGQLVERVLHGNRAEEEPAVAPAPAPVEAASASASEDEPYPFIDEPAPVQTTFDEQPVEEPQQCRPSVVRHEQQQPAVTFEEIDPSEEQSSVTDAAVTDAAPTEVVNGPFVEIDTAEDRVVMGRGGLVELSPRRTAKSAPRTTTDGLVEIDLDKLMEHPTEPPKECEKSVVEPIAERPAAPAPQTVQQPVAEPEPEGLVVTVEVPKEDAEASNRELKSELYDPTKDLLTYRKPPVSLLEDYTSSSEVSEQEIFENKTKIEETLANFGIPIQKIKATVGPTVTLYEIVQAQGVKIAKIQGLEQDIAQSLKALGIRIIAPIPGKGTIGIEVPNQNKQIVSMYSAVRSKRFYEFAQRAELPVVIGRTIQNENFCFDLAKLPHLLVAGATGQGKSVGLNAIITSLLYHKHPSQLKLVMVDPKMVEFSVYGGLERHFLAKMESEDRAIITDPMKAVYTLNSLCTEMDSRLELLSKATSRNIVEYNQKFTERRLNPEKGHRYLPYIVVVVDEFADLIMMAREVERPVMRLAQKARAVGIHLIIATQRPDVKVITGGIKANFPARIAFRVMQMIDSRTILDRPGANQLIGRGDMLFSKDGEVTRIQCALVETKEVERIVECISKQQGYPEAYPLPDYVPEGGDAVMGSEEADLAPKKYDSLFAEIARDAVQSGSISTSMIQRNYEVGFNRAGRIMMQLERAGIVGRQQGAKPRDVLFHDSPSLEAKLQELGLF